MRTTELTYVKTIPWQCTCCGAHGHVEDPRYRWQIFERAWSEHERADPDCASQFEGRYVLIEETTE